MFNYRVDCVVPDNIQQLMHGLIVIKSLLFYLDYKSFAVMALM